MPKPHRVLLDRVSSYADEAGAFMRRRRLTRRPFARVYYSNGHGTDQAPDSDAGAELFAAAAQLIEVAGRPRRPAKRE
jgi:hypothetical protein